MSGSFRLAFASCCELKKEHGQMKYQIDNVGVNTIVSQINIFQKICNFTCGITGQ